MYINNLFIFVGVILRFDSRLNLGCARFIITWDRAARYLLLDNVKYTTTKLARQMVIANFECRSLYFSAVSARTS